MTWSSVGQQSVVELGHGRVEHLHGPEVDKVRLRMSCGPVLALHDARLDAVDALEQKARGHSHRPSAHHEHPRGAGDRHGALHGRRSGWKCDQLP